MAAKQLPHDKLHFDNCAAFCADVETLVRESNTLADEHETLTGKTTLRIKYIEAVLEIADKRKIEPEFAAEYLNPEIKEHLRTEYEHRHMLPRTATLPF